MLYTIGYQDKTIEEFISLLQEREVEFLLDVRSKPFSKLRNFSRDVLKKKLEENGISYTWAGATLGGFAESKESEIVRLSKWQSNKKAAIMCMEADPRKCHRFKIAARLGRYGVEVAHITKGGGGHGIEAVTDVCEP